MKGRTEAECLLTETVSERLCAARCSRAVFRSRCRQTEWRQGHTCPKTAWLRRYGAVVASLPACSKRHYLTTFTAQTEDDQDFLFERERHKLAYTHGELERVQKRERHTNGKHYVHTEEMKESTAHSARYAWLWRFCPAPLNHRC